MATKRNNTGLTRKQVLMAELLANPESEQRTITDMCNEVGVARSTFYRSWLNEPAFVTYVDELIEKYTSSALGLVWADLIRNCHKGDTAAIKLFFEMKNKYKQQVQHSGEVVVFSGEDKLE